jgi:hypothetical protein
MCDRCGAWVPATRLDDGRHTCHLETLLEFQGRLARLVIEQELETTLATWERDPHVAKHVAFARYLRDREAA